MMQPEVDLSKWRQVGPVWMRLYKCGTLGIVRPSDNEWTCEALLEDGGLHDSPICAVFQVSREAIQADMDAEYDPPPEPEVTRFDTVTVFKLNGRETVLYKSPVDGDWYHIGKAVCPEPRTRKRDDVETAARQWLIEQARKGGS